MCRCYLLAVSLALSLVHLAIGQIEVRAKYEGEWLPVVAASGQKAFVMKEGKRKDAWTGNVQINPAEAFGSGEVTVGNIKADLDPLKNVSVKERSRPNQVLFRYSADVTSAGDLADCYAVLVFVTNGSVGVNLQPIGRLKAGQPKRVEVETANRVDEVSDLHVFSGTKEIRSNLVAAPYDARELWARLAAGAGGVSAVELCKAEEPVLLALSRDGKHLATTRDRGDHFSIVIFDLATVEPVCEVAADKEYKRVGSLVWAGSEAVAFVVDKKLKLLDVKTTACTQLRDRVLSIVRSAEQKPEILSLIVEGVNWWERLTVSYDTKAKRTVDWDELENGWTLFDPNGEPRLRYVIDGPTKEFFARIGDSKRWVKLDSTVKEPGLKFSGKGDQYLDRTVEVESLGQDGDTIYISTRVGSDTFQLAAYSLSQGRIVRKIASHPKYDLTEADYSECRVLVHRATSEVIGIVYNAEKPKVLWLDPSFAAVQKALEGKFPGQSVQPVTWSDDGGTFIYFVGSDQNPGEIYAFILEQKKLVRLFAHSERLEPSRLAKTTPMDFVARDGATVHAYLTLPPQPSSRPLPLLVSVHGGPMARDSWSFNATNQFFATRGYAVLQVNFRGSSGYGAAYQAAGLRARLDTVVLDDIADGVHAALATGNIDPRRIAITGASFGGWATYMSLIKYPEIFRAGIAVSAVSHLRDMQKDWRRADNRYGFACWQDILGRKDFEANERFIDPLLRAGELHQPIYIMHGEYDWVVQASQAGEMLKALQKHNPNVRSKSFPFATHSDWSELDRVTQLNEIEGFLRTHLAPVGATNVAAAAASSGAK